jgi:formate dehydrogenase major subunit
MLEHLKQTDYGTPKRESADEVTLEIDGESITVAAGTSLMRAAVDAGVNIPKLCATDSLEPFGSCRLCLVEIEGRKGYPASCTTPAEAGMKVRTQTPRLQELRKGVMELYISDHPLDCLTCSANGNCELQDMAGVTGLPRLILARSPRSRRGWSSRSSKIPIGAKRSMSCCPSLVTGASSTVRS